MSVNIEHLTIQQLEELIEQAELMIEQKREQALASAKAEIERIAASAGVTVEALMGLSAGKPARKAVKKPVADKYRNPKDHTQGWSGRGKKPKWVQEYEAQGGKLENILVR